MLLSIVKIVLGAVKCVCQWPGVIGGSSDRDICWFQKKAMFIPSGGQTNLGSLELWSWVLALWQRPPAAGIVRQRLQSSSQAFELPTGQVCGRATCVAERSHIVAFGVCFCEEAMG
jgi:hypothetical protein